jgi:hypothetical protein
MPRTERLFKSVVIMSCFSLLMLTSCNTLLTSINYREDESIELLEGHIPEYEIVFYAENKGPNILGFVDPEQGQPIFRKIDAPYGMTNYVRWSADGVSIVGRLAPTTNPNASYPMLITRDGQTLFCKYVGSGYAWGVGENRVITNNSDTGQVILIDMETCDILSVLYENEGGIGSIIVSDNGLALVAIPKKYVLFDTNNKEVLQEFTLQGVPQELSSDASSMLIENNGIFILGIDEMAEKYVAPSGWVAWSPDESEIVYSDFEGNIGIRNLKTGEQKEVVSGGLSPSWRTLPQ